MYQLVVSNHGYLPSPQLVSSTDKSLWDQVKSTTNQQRLLMEHDKSTETLDKSRDYRDKLLWDQSKSTVDQDKMGDQDTSTEYQNKLLLVKCKSDQEDSDNQEEIIMIDASSSDDQGDGKDLMLSCDIEEDVTAEVVLKKFVEDSDMSSDDQ